MTVPRSRYLLKRAGFGGGVFRYAGDMVNDCEWVGRAGVDSCAGFVICMSGTEMGGCACVCARARRCDVRKGAGSKAHREVSMRTASADG